MFISILVFTVHIVHFLYLYMFIFTRTLFYTNGYIYIYTCIINTSSVLSCIGNHSHFDIVINNNETQFWASWIYYMDFVRVCSWVWHRACTNILPFNMCWVPYRYMRIHTSNVTVTGQIYSREIWWCSLLNIQQQMSHICDYIPC